MDTGLDKAKLLQYHAQIAKLIGDPAKMRLAVVLAATALAIGAVYYPLSGQIEQERVEVESQKKRLETIQAVESLRRDVKAFRSRVDKQSDTNEWVQYMLAGSRQIGVRLRSMETKDPRKVGPYLAVPLTMEMQGTYLQLKSFVEWLDQSERLLRIDALRLEKTPGFIIMRVNVFGLVPKNAKETR
jgi:Tfp pilus assembly protein PilO